jgi:uncharacterized protein
MTTAAFAPFQDLARTLLPHAFDDNGDGSHDTSHLQRVWKSAAAIQAEEGGDAEVLFASTLLHDCVAVEKNSPLRAQASRLSAEKAAGVLASLGWPDGWAARYTTPPIRTRRDVLWMTRATRSTISIPSC